MSDYFDPTTTASDEYWTKGRITYSADVAVILRRPEKVREIGEIQDSQNASRALIESARPLFLRQREIWLMRVGKFRINLVFWSSELRSENCKQELVVFSLESFLIMILR